jgi:4-hydroxybenzoate polyprenyltransferase
MPTLAQRWMGRGNTVKPEYSLSEKAAGFLDITRPILTVTGALGVSAAAALAYGGFPPWQQCVLGFLAALLAYGGIHTFNDFADSRRDIGCWPGRPIPSHRLTARQSLWFALLCFAVALGIIAWQFNWTCLVVCVIAIGLSCLYSAYLRDRVGYLSLPFIVGTLWLCGWSAFSPASLFSSWEPWVLYLFSVAWQAGHIMIYSPLHPIRRVNNIKLTQVPAFLVTTSPHAAVLLGVIFLVITFGLGLFVGFFLNLGLIYLIPVGVMGLIALYFSWRFLPDSENFAKGIRAFTIVTYYMTLARVCILLSLLIKVMN